MEKRILGDYTVLKTIGQGCLGSVYLAEHRFIKKHFAIKVLPDDLANDRAFVQRFEKEIASYASLDHPHLVKVHNVSYADGLFFIVMDCIVDTYGETTNLFQYLSIHQCKMSENEFVNLLTQVASCLDYAHQKKVGDQFLIHRNLKLNNLLVGKKDLGIHLYLTDFGLTKLIGEGAILSRTFKNITESLSIEGSIDKYSTQVEPKKLSKLHLSFLQNYSFLSPEQKDLSHKTPLTPRVDTYAFGVLAYYMLTKTYPEGVFTLPSKVLPELKLDWDYLLTQCLQMNPNNRPSSLMEIMNELKTSTRKKITQKEEPTYKEPLREEPIRHSEERAIPAFSPSSSSASMQAPYVFPKTPTLRSASHQDLSSAPKEPTVKPCYEEHVATLQREEVHHVHQALPEPKPILKPQEIQRPTYESDPSTIFQLESTVARYIPQEKEIKDIEPLLSDMMIVPGGEYFRGSDEGCRDERPKHRVFINSYALDIHPVTNEQYVRFLEVMGGEKDANNNDIIRLRESRIKRSSGKLLIESGYAKHPVVGVSWYGATAYAKWVGKRLPTEAEWEIASNSGIGDMIYPTGTEIERSEANFFSSDTVNVMSYPCNQFGLYDMAGNVYEWCQDWYDYNYYEVSAQEPDSPKGPHQGVYRVLRGGCWKSLKDDLRCQHRHRNNPGTVNKTYGFRCAADVK